MAIAGEATPEAALDKRAMGKPTKGEARGGETIFALSSAPGRAAIAVIRVSGPRAGEALQALAGRALPAPRYAAYRRLADPASKRGIDDAVVLWFPGPASETGENVAELQIHGGRATIAGVLGALAALPGLRLAEPGEFTRRAFLNGKLDLTAVEGLADLIDAETEAQRRQALRQLRGKLGRLYDGWRDRLLRLLAHVEARIDFPEETEDAAAEADFRSGFLPGISLLIVEVTQHLGDDKRGERLRDGLSIAILGAPNVGKSSLLNLVARRDVAIVSEMAGTTRDVLEVHLDLSGYPVILADTAGIRESGDVVEREGIRRALARAEQADLRLVLLDATIWPRIPPEIEPLIDDTAILVLNKIDRNRSADMREIGGRMPIGISALSGEGMDALIAELARRASTLMELQEAPAVTRLRHRQALERCVAALRRAAAQNVPELMAEDLRLATRELGRVTGRVDVEDLLDIVFRDFCIGK